MIDSTLQEAIRLTRVDRNGLPHWAKFTKLMQECGEFAEASLVEAHLKDSGSIGEAADIILCVIDALATSHLHAGEPATSVIAELESELIRKLTKWQTNKMKLDTSFITVDYPNGLLLAHAQEEAALPPFDRQLEPCDLCDKPCGGNKIKINVTFDSIVEVIKELIGDEVAEITRLSSNIYEDLAFDELDVIEFVMAIEDQHGIEIPDHKMEHLKTIDEWLDFLNETYFKVMK